MKRKSLIISVILVVALIVSLAVTAVACGGGDKPKTVVTIEDLDVQMYDKDANTTRYMVGTKNELDLTKAFPGATAFSGAGVEGNKIAKAVDGKLSYTDKDGKAVSTNVYAVDALNVYGESMETDMRDNLANGVSVVMHEDLTTKGTAGFGIANCYLYGNGHELHGDSIAAPKSAKKNKSAWGATLLYVGKNAAGVAEALHVEDLHIFANTVEGNTITLEDFEYSGSAIDVSASQPKVGQDYAAQSTIKNCIVENGQKLLHIAGANVLVEGSIFRNGADANIASGTYPNRKGSKVTIKNSVSANSMVAGYLFYGYEKFKKNDDVQYAQQTLDVEGFFDIYNWKTTDTTKLVPSTENLPILAVADIVNENVQKEIKTNEDFAPCIFRTEDGKEYVHIGIVRLSTSNHYNTPKILYNGKEGNMPQYVDKEFPLPGWATGLGIVKGCNMIAFKNQGDLNGETLSVMPGQGIPDTIYADMAFGRK